MFGYTDAQKTGVVLTALGFLFIFLGVVLFFDGGLLAIGNILLFTGITLILGVKRTLQFFNPCLPNRTPNKLRGIVCIAIGVTMLLLRRGWSTVALLIELIGLVEMFGSFLPVVLAALRQLPYVGPVLSAPGVAGVLDSLAGASRLPRRAPV